MLSTIHHCDLPSSTSPQVASVAPAGHAISTRQVIETFLAGLRAEWARREPRLSDLAQHGSGE